jgi:hypothetical protein
MLIRILQMFTAKEAPFAQLPDSRVGRKPHYPFIGMEPGDSFFEPGLDATRLGGAGRAYLLRHPRPGYRFVCRTLTEGGVTGARIWLVKSRKARKA